MECRTLVITLVSADNLPDVRNLFQMKVYAKVSIKGEQKTAQKTPVDLRGETNPRWNFPIVCTISESGVQNPGAELKIELFCERSLGDRFIGEVKVSVKGLFDMGFKSEKSLTYDVGGTSEGKLNILYSFGEKIWVEKRKGWRKAVGDVFLVLVGGALVLLSGELDHDDDDDCGGKFDVLEDCNDQDDDEEKFYDAQE